MAEKVETASEFLRKLGDWARVDSPFGGYRARAAESLIDKRDSAIAAAAELRGRLATIERLERCAENMRWNDDRNMLIGICQLLRDELQSEGQR